MVSGRLVAKKNQRTKTGLIDPEHKTDEFKNMFQFYKKWGPPPSFFLRFALHDHVRPNLFPLDLEWLAADRRHKIPLLVRVGAVHPEDVKLVTVPESSDSFVREVLDDVR